MKKLLLISLVIFSSLMILGVFLSSRKQLWNDELYTQQNIEKASYVGIAHGDLIEGNACPLFYLGQKAFLSLFNFHFPLEWRHEFCVYELRSQILLRIPTVIYISLGITLIFLTFARLYSLPVGLIALALSVAHPMIQQYWAEARPYSLWFLLTVVQACLFLQFLCKPQKKTSLYLGLCHLLLALTFIFSLPQILIVTAFIRIVSKKDRVGLIISAFVCALIFYYYSSQVKKFYGFVPTNTLGTALFTLQHSWQQCFVFIKDWFTPLLFLNIPWPLLLPLGFYLIYLSLRLFFKGQPILKESIVFLGTFLSLVLASIAILFLFSVWEISGLAKYGAPERYFIFLVPYCIIAVVLSILNLFKAASDPIMRAVVITIAIGTLIVTMINALASTIWLGFY